MTTTKQIEPVEVFVAYAHQDSKLKDDLLTRLRGLRRLGLIAEWHDRCIDAGEDWRSEISDRIDKAEIILLLISPDFLASDYCTEIEMDAAIRKHIERTGFVIPIILRHAEGWEDHGPKVCKLGDIQSLPTNGRPVTDYENHDHAWALVTKGIRESLYKLELPSRTAVEPRQEKGEGFVDRLVRADAVTIIGLTNENLIGHLENALTQRKQQGRGFWSNLDIIFGTREFLSQLPQEINRAGLPRDGADRLAKLTDSKDRMMRFLLAQGISARSQWTCREYPDRLPFVGSIYNFEDKSFLRVAMILPGVDQKDAFYMEQVSGHPFFEQLSNTFDYVRERSRRLVEWVLRGDFNEKIFTLTGITRRTHIDRLKETWAAVVIIMIHNRNDKGHFLMLQKRSKYNAADRLGTFSNISGMVTDVDLLSTQVSLDLFGYLKANYRQNRNDEDAWEEFLKCCGSAPKLIVDPVTDLTLTTFRLAAVRELNEELGLELTQPSDLKFQRFYPLTRSNNVNLLFGIFSLEVDGEQISTICMRKPHADLQRCNRKQIRELYDSDMLNLLLQVRFEKVFEPLIEKLGIE